MAQIVENEKGFKVIKIKTTEMFEIWQGTLGICDNCNMPVTIDDEMAGYYVAVLNRVLCGEDYKSWMERAKYYPEDSRIEDKNFEATKNLLNL